MQSPEVLRHLLKQWPVVRHQFHIKEQSAFERAFVEVTGEPVSAADVAFWDGRRFWTSIGPFLTTETAVWMIVTIVGLYAIIRRRQQRAAQRKRWEEQGLD